MLDRINIIIAEDQLSVRQAYVSRLEQENVHTIGQASNGRELITLLEVEKLLPDIILLDLDMPVMDGNVALKIIRAKFPSLKVIILSIFDEVCLINDFLAKGASAYLTKNTDFKIITSTIKRVHYTPDVKVISNAKSIFTKGEISIIPLLLAGKKTKQIAQAIGKAEKTVEEYRSHLLDKTNTRNVSEFSSYCTKVGLALLGNLHLDKHA